MIPDIKDLLRESAGETEELLNILTKDQDASYPVLCEAMRYSLLSGGKRIRPFLVSAFAELFGGNHAHAVQLGCALEMIHTYSLIHDDLPCMDNDDLRRGRPTSHKVFGEATATLTGDALLTMAFDVASHPAAVPSKLGYAAVRLLSLAAGKAGMIGGQMIDMRGETEPLDFETLLEMHAKKTGALIEAACLLGCFCAGIFDKNDDRYRAAIFYAHGIGLAFQIVDDCLDAVGDEAALGKSVGSDAASGKTTFLTFMTTDDAMEYARTLTEGAKAAIAEFEGSETLCALADYLLERKN